MRHTLAVIGFGTVGQGFAEILAQDGDALKEKYGIDFDVVAISDQVKGAVADPKGLNLPLILESVKISGDFTQYPDNPGVVRDWDSFQTIIQSNADTVIEATYTNITNGQPGLDHCRTALESGKNVVTTNKGPIALGLDELQRLAQEHGTRILYEGSVMSGTPVLRLAEASLAGDEIQTVRGILNGTSNYILTRMEDGLGFDQALGEAQTLGYAEADPTNDIDGYDAQFKLLILAQALFGTKLRKEDVFRRGIRHIDREDIFQTHGENRRYKLVASLEKTTSGLMARVAPEIIPWSDPLAGVYGAVNALTYHCRLAGDITIVGPGAGRTETGYALLVDCINLCREQI